MKSVIKGAGYILVHTPDMVLHNGTTQTTERIVNPESEYLKELPSHIRSFEQVLSYWPNQVYIGNKHPDELAGAAQPWCDKTCDVSERFGPFGQMMPQEEFLLLMQACDVFDLVKLEQGFVDAHRAALAANPIIDETIMARIPEAQTAGDEIERLVAEEHSEGLYHNGALVGCVNRAHDIDVNLSAHVMHENLVSKASSVMALLSAVKNAGISKDDVEYVVDCAEEACGDMNLDNATGSDARGFCAAPAHAMIEAASLVASGAYKTVIVTAGGCTAKLGMNGKDHVKKGLPILEDMIGGFAVVLTQDDGVSPEINLDMLGRHTVGTGSAPQAVISSLVTAPLDKHGLKITDIDKYSPEMQNPDITKPAGAGDVPLANYKMIAALAVKRGELQKADLASFPVKLSRVMIIGKGSLFLGRMTNLFDGVSFVIQANSGAEKASGVSEDEVKSMIAKAMKDFAATLMADAE